MQRPACRCLRNICAFSNLINQFGFVHISPLVIQFNKQETPTSNAGAIFGSRTSAQVVAVI
ncbi:hypothetical protein [uncultured Zoogloea sp.]|uniref:hypothetical protein n=1 Tax=Zoogloea sp. 1C4 TaxID=2570190 RepID=UPI00345C619D